MRQATRATNATLTVRMAAVEDDAARRRPRPSPAPRPAKRSGCASSSAPGQREARSGAACARRDRVDEQRPGDERAAPQRDQPPAGERRERPAGRLAARRARPRRSCRGSSAAPRDRDADDEPAAGARADTARRCVAGATSRLAADDPRRDPEDAGGRQRQERQQRPRPERPDRARPATMSDKADAPHQVGRPPVAPS